MGEYFDLFAFRLHSCFFFYNQKQPFRGVLKKSVLKICSKFTGEHPYQSVISIKLLFNFIEIALRHKCSPVNLLHIFKTPFSRNTFGWLLLYNIDLHLANRDQHNTLENQTNIQQQKNKIWTILTQHWLKSWCVYIQVLHTNIDTVFMKRIVHSMFFCFMIGQKKGPMKHSEGFKSLITDFLISLFLLKVKFSDPYRRLFERFSWDKFLKVGFKAQRSLKCSIPESEERLQRKR